MTDIIERLESNDRDVVETAKQNFREQFMKISDPWLINGIFDYYLSTDSERAMEILVNITDPHCTYLFDRLAESIKGPKMEIKVKSLTMFGYLARSQRTWFYKVQDHNLLKDMLNLLKSEVELLPLISALLVLIVMLPVIPSAMGNHLKDIFEIFSRLASWNCSPGKMVEDQLIHLQVALYALFLRLYGMYPCNFLGYLRNKYKDKDIPVFVHTIKPMLDTVKMNPSLVTATKDTEITTERWKKMGVHEVIVECERFSLDLTDRCPHDTCQYTTGFRSRSGTTNSTIESSYQLQNVKGLTSLQITSSSSENPNFFTPSRNFHVQTPPISETVPTNIPQVQGSSTNFPSHEGTSPPEAAIEATPETTPVRDYRTIPARSQQLNSNIARALTTFNNKNRPSSSASLTSTPSHSQPSSPMRKENSPFNYPDVARPNSAFIPTRLESRVKHKLNKLVLDRTQAVEISMGTVTSTDISKEKTLPPPSSPLRIINPEKQFITNQRVESPFSREDEEVLSIVSKTDTIPMTSDFVIEDIDEESNDKIQEEMEKGSPCTAGGLHMPNSKSMNNFAKRVQRLRHHSQCNPEPERTETSTGSSPGNGIHFSNSTTVRRAVSCPEMKKSPNISSKDKKTKPLAETDEDTAVTVERKCNSNGLETSTTTCRTSTTQTDNFWAYEHMFLGVFPSLENNYIRPSPAPSPSPYHTSQEKEFPPSVYDILDRYIEVATTANDKNSPNLKEQLQLLHQHLLFERHRRETHASRNRRLLSNAKSTRLSDEYISALRDTIQLKEKDLDSLRTQLEEFKSNKLEEEKKLNKTIQYWENEYKSINVQLQKLKETNDMMVKELTDIKNKCAITDTEFRQTQEELLDAIAEVNVARQQAQAGDKGRKELEQVNRELLLIGELHLKYQERLDKVDAHKEVYKELDQVKEAYREEVKALNQQLEAKAVALEAYRTRILELEHIITSKDDQILSQKKNLADINEQRFEKLDAVESKYLSQITINRTLEEKILDLRQRLDLEKGRRAVNSPDTSSCHEVNVTTTAGFSPHSSPLSASLASSEGSVAFHEREVKNLQALVDQKDSTSKARAEETGESLADIEEPVASPSKID